MLHTGRHAALAAAILLGLGTPALAKNIAPVKVQDRGALKGSSQVTVAAFNVGFIFESVDQTKSTGGLIGAFGGTTKAKSTLVGVTPQMMQQVADAAYADFLAKLRSQGFTVAEPEAAFADPAMQKLKGNTGPTEINLALEKGSKGKATFYRPSALPQQVMLAGDFVGSGMSSIGLNMQAGQNSSAVGAYARSSGVPVVDVVYLIDFSQQQRPGAFSMGGLKVNANLAMTSGFSKMTVVGANGKQNAVGVAQPVSVDGEFIKVEDATSGASKAGQAAANVAGGVAAAFGLGGFGFGKSRTFEFTAVPGNYEEGATKAASLANQMLVDQLVLER